jgi:hypothetical protein
MEKKKRMSARETAATIFALYCALFMLMLLWVRAAAFRGGEFAMQCSLDTRIVMSGIAVIFASMSIYRIVKYRDR